MINNTQNLLVEDENIFIEQAEYIDEAAFLKWGIEQPDENTIIRKLSQGGAKLITGPRGCGKTTLMLKTFNKLCADSKATSLPIYVNFKTSLQLEPLYKKGRVNEHAKFCSNCGVVLKTGSIFDEIVKHDIEKLGLTKKRVQTIKEHSDIRTIKDILMDHDNRELRGISSIGEIWAKLIRSLAEEYIS